MATIQRQRELEASAEEVWGRIGDFNSADSWHPAIASQTGSEDGTVRELTTVDGAVIVETLLDQGENFYSYRIDDSPLPLAKFQATLRAEPSGSGSTVIWEAEFEPSGASEEEALGIVGGIFDAGLDAI